MSIILEPQNSKVPPCRCRCTLTWTAMRIAMCGAMFDFIVRCNVWVHHLGLLQSFPVPALIKVFLVSISQMNRKRTNWYLRSCLTLELVQSSFVCFNSVLQPHHHMKPLHQLRRFASENHLFSHFTPSHMHCIALPCTCSQADKNCADLLILSQCKIWEPITAGGHCQVVT